MENDIVRVLPAVTRDVVHVGVPVPIMFAYDRILVPEIFTPGEELAIHEIVDPIVECEPAYTLLIEVKGIPWIRKFPEAEV